MTNPSEQALPFSEAAREAAARTYAAQQGRSATAYHRKRSDRVLMDAVNADPRLAAFLKLAALSDEERLNLIGEAFAEQENARRYEGGPHTSPMVEPTEYDASDFEDEARMVLAALGLPVAEGEATG